MRIPKRFTLSLAAPWSLPQVIGKVRGSSEQNRESIPMRLPLEILFRYRGVPLRPVRSGELRDTVPQLLVDFLPCGFERWPGDFRLYIQYAFRYSVYIGSATK
jgi:hypothetical protein